MKRFIAIVQIISLGSVLHVGAYENAIPLTRYLQDIVVSERKIVRKLHGVVTDANGEPLEGVEVDVLNHAERISKGQSGNSVEQHVLASAVTGRGGRFKFENLPAGAYEVRCRKSGFEELHIYVEVRPRSRGKKGLEIRLGLAI